MRFFFLFILSATVAACSSSSDPAPTSDAAGDTATAADVASDTYKAPTDTAVADGTDDDATVEDSDGVDVKPPPDKCAGKVCSGSYQGCCATTGACYDTRCASCCY